MIQTPHLLLHFILQNHLLIGRSMREKVFFDNGAVVPTSGLNLPIEDGLIAYWKMDEVNETTLTAGAFTIEDNSTSNNDINVNAGGGGANVARTYWGTKNRSINFDPTDSIAVTNANITDSGTNGTFTFLFGHKVLTRSIHLKFTLVI